MKNKAENRIIYILLSITAIIMMVPFIWMILTSFKTIAETTAVDPLVIFPSEWKVDAYLSVTQMYDFYALYANTLILIFIRIILAIVTSSTAAYALARLEFKGKNIVFGLVLLQMMVPTQIYLIPQYKIVANLNMLNTMFALVLPGIVSTFGVFLLRQAFLALPMSLEEAAKIEGCNPPQVFFYVMLPLTKSSMVALGIFTALFAYKELMWPMIVNTRNDSMTLSVALAKLQGQYTTNYPELMAAAVIASVPIILLYLIFQKQFIEGVATSGAKL
ncbi:MAG: carbohydrate ABC transporter permease [Eubacteriales bacterium]